jgi:hypothetical protein
MDPTQNHVRMFFSTLPWDWGVARGPLQRSRGFSVDFYLRLPLISLDK